VGGVFQGGEAVIISWSISISSTVRGLHGHVTIKYHDGNSVHHVLQGNTWQEMARHAEAIIPAPVPEVASAG
jgi:hypothetical protein